MDSVSHGDIAFNGSAFGLAFEDCYPSNYWKNLLMNIRLRFNFQVLLLVKTKVTVIVVRGAVSTMPRTKMVSLLEVIILHF